ncbi:hypothetical protein [Klebsiella pneumoniae]|jgi:hypothetical protein|uniref:hypothetical protein n=1 Tax=Klebsiella pneumoniae TaxID=573 RepID=UPI003BA3477C
MNDEMLYARIAYIIPFQKGPGASREPVLLIRAKQHEEIAFDISLFFIGLKPSQVYLASYSIRPAKEDELYPQFFFQKNSELMILRLLADFCQFLSTLQLPYPTVFQPANIASMPH